MGNVTISIDELQKLWFMKQEKPIDYAKLINRLREVLHDLDHSYK